MRLPHTRSSRAPQRRQTAPRRESRGGDDLVETASPLGAAEPRPASARNETETDNKREMQVQLPHTNRSSGDRTEKDSDGYRLDGLANLNVYRFCVSLRQSIRLLIAEYRRVCQCYQSSQWLSAPYLQLVFVHTPDVHGVLNQANAFFFPETVGGREPLP